MKRDLKGYRLPTKRRPVRRPIWRMVDVELDIALVAAARRRAEAFGVTLSEYVTGLLWRDNCPTDAVKE